MKPSGPERPIPQGHSQARGLSRRSNNGTRMSEEGAVPDLGGLANHWDTVDLYPRSQVGTSWRGSSPVCSGLHNPRHMCFMNASFQILFHLPPLVAWIQEMKDFGSEALGQFTGMIVRLHEGMKVGGGECVAATEFWRTEVVRQICGEHCEGRMEDAQEWMMGVLAMLHDEAIEGATGVPKSQVHTALGEAQYSSFMYRIFGGLLRTQISCQGQDVISSIRERFTSLEVDIGGAKSVEEALRSYTREEELTGENKYRWEYGAGEQDFKMVDAVRRTTIEEAPPVLTILLKRFPCPDIKIQDSVGFGETLDLQEFMSEEVPESTNGTKYNLVGVLVHKGPTTTSGHYVAYVKEANESWKLFNDSRVISVSRKEVLKAEAYVLVYTKQHPSYEADEQAVTKKSKKRPLDEHGNCIPGAGAKRLKSRKSYRLAAQYAHLTGFEGGDFTHNSLHQNIQGDKQENLESGRQKWSGRRRKGSLIRGGLKHGGDSRLGQDNHGASHTSRLCRKRPEAKDETTVRNSRKRALEDDNTDDNNDCEGGDEKPTKKRWAKWKKGSQK